MKVPLKVSPMVHRSLVMMALFAAVVAFPFSEAGAQTGPDDCTHPAVLTDGVPFFFDTGIASADTHGLTCQIHRDLWFRFSVSQTGILVTSIATITGAPTDFAHAIYLEPAPGQCPTDADLLNCLQLPGGSQSGVAVNAGVNVLLRVGTWHSGATPTGEITVTVQPPALNDDCATPEPMTLPGVATFDTLWATPSSSILDCQSFQHVFSGDHFPDLWFSVTTPTDGALYVVADSTQVSLAVYQQPQGGGCPQGSDLVRCATGHEVYARAYPGETYLIRVSKSWQGTIAGEIDVELLPLVPNDDCAAATPIAIPSVTQFDIAAAFDSGDPSCDVLQDVWYTVTPASSGFLAVEIGGPGHPASHAVYEVSGPGSCPTTPVISCASGLHVWESVTSVIGGVTYAIRVGSASFTHLIPAPGTELRVSMVQAPPNDDCSAGAATLLTIPSTVQWDNLAANDDQAGLPCPVPRRDLWYRFTAPVTGSLQIELLASTVGQNANNRGAHAIYADLQGGAICPATVDELHCTEADSSVIDVALGESYLLRMGSDSDGLRLHGDLDLRYVVGPPRDVNCDASVGGQVTATYSIPPGNNYDDGVEVYVDGMLAATIPQTQLSYTELLPPAFVGVVEIGFVGLNSTMGMSDLSTCSVAVGGPPNDLCVDALPIVMGAHPFDNTVTTLDPSAPTPPCVGLPGNDLWFSFVAPAFGPYFADTCAGIGAEGFVEVWEATGGCPQGPAGRIVCASDGCMVGSRAVWDGVAGAPYWIRVGGYGGLTGPGTLTVGHYCAEITDLTCDYDCLLQEGLLAWSPHSSHINFVVESDLDGVLGMTQISSYQAQGLSVGVHTLTITANCPNGTTATASCTLSVVTGGASDDVVLALEGAGGSVDSASALAASLTAHGRAVTVVGEDFFDHHCAPDFLSGASVIWVCAGTAPEAHALSSEERNELVALISTGLSLYMEGADLWGSDYAPSDLDAWDGLNIASVEDGDDSLNTVVGTAGTITGSDFSGHPPRAYTQDNPTGDDSNDRLFVGTGDAGVSSVPIFVSGGGYPVTVLARDNTTLSVVISSSWEIGGVAGATLPDPAVTAIVGDYLSVFAGLSVPEFVRGDVVGLDGSVNIADAIALLTYLFPQGPPTTLDCADAADCDASGSLNLPDAILLLTSLFGQPPAILPYPNVTDGCGVAEQLGCTLFPGCP